MISQFLYNKASETTEAAPSAKASTEIEEDALTANPLDAMTKP